MLLEDCRWYTQHGNMDPERNNDAMNEYVWVSEGALMSCILTRKGVLSISHIMSAHQLLAVILSVALHTLSKCHLPNVRFRQLHICLAQLITDTTKFGGRHM